MNSNILQHCTGARNHSCIMSNAPGNMIYLLPEKTIHDQRCCYILARSRDEDGGGGGCEWMEKRVLEVACVYTRSEDCRVGARATGDEMISGRQG